jgi:hypothetical protein
MLDGVLCLLTLAVCALALVLPPSLELGVALGIERSPPLANVAAHSAQLVP